MKKNNAKIQNVRQVTAFFNTWHIYQKMVTCNYHAHREVYGIFRKFLQKKFSRQKFSLLDLGCGDAKWMARILKGIALRQYTGVDLSETALGLAKKNLAKIPCTKKWILGNLWKEIRRQKGQDVIWVCLAFHHLRLKQKKEFLAACQKSLVPGGCLIFYEPTLREGETRKAFLKRWFCHGNKHWKALDPDEFVLHEQHIARHDFPERLSTYACFAKTAGFLPPRVLFTHPADVLKMVMLEKKTAA